MLRVGRHGVVIRDIRDISTSARASAANVHRRRPIGSSCIGCLLSRMLVHRRRSRRACHHYCRTASTFHRSFLLSFYLTHLSVLLAPLASQHVLRVAQRLTLLGKLAQLLDFFTVMTPSHLLLILVPFQNHRFCDSVKLAQIPLRRAHLAAVHG